MSIALTPFLQFVPICLGSIGLLIANFLAYKRAPKDLRNHNTVFLKRVTNGVVLSLISLGFAVMLLTLLPAWMERGHMEKTLIFNMLNACAIASYISFYLAHTVTFLNVVMFSPYATNISYLYGAFNIVFLGLSGLCYLDIHEWIPKEYLREILVVFHPDR